MKPRHVLACLLCLINITAFAQTVITYPINGSVFQHNQGSAIINFAGQINNPATDEGTRYYKIEKKDNNSGTWSIYNSQIDILLSSSFLYSNLFGSKYAFYHTLASLTIGWYRITTYIIPTGTNTHQDEDQHYFGIGDVYYVAGQSNASGFNDSDYDNSIPYYNSAVVNEMARVYSYGGDNGSNQKPIKKGLPYKFTFFSNFNHGSSSDLMPIYPNGVASWSWSILGNKIANEKGIPTMFFNVAYPNTSLVYDWVGYPTPNPTTSPNTLIGKFFQTLKTYGGTLGAKAVLWQQGERDSQNMTDNNVNTITLNNYVPDLNGLISQSRSVLTAELSWYVSQVSYFIGGNWNTNGHDKRTFLSTCQPDASRPDITRRFTLQALKNLQSSVVSSANKIYNGVDSDNYGTDQNNDSVIDTECERASTQRIHFTGNSLETLANGWYSALDANYSNTAVSPNKLLQLTAVSQVVLTIPNGGGDACCFPKLTVEIPPNGSSTYYWVRNDAGINNADSVTTINNYVFANFQSGDVASCYVENNGKLYACQAFVDPIEGFPATPCPENLTLSNSIAGQTKYYQAAQTITATNQIYGSNVTYQAGHSITLQPGFKADNTNVFVAKIEGCQ